jgi:hypothetical protein
MLTPRARTELLRARPTDGQPAISRLARSVVDNAPERDDSPLDNESPIERQRVDCAISGASTVAMQRELSAGAARNIVLDQAIADHSTIPVIGQALFNGHFRLPNKQADTARMRVRISGARTGDLPTSRLLTRHARSSFTIVDQPSPRPVGDPPPTRAALPQRRSRPSRPLSSAPRGPR